MGEYTPSEARLRERVKGSLGEYAHEFGIDGEAAMDAWIDQALAERDNLIRADERAKRPDREQGPDVLSAEERTEIWSALRYQATTVDDMIRAQLRLGRGLDDPQQVADAVRRDGLIELAGRVRDSSSLALEPEARKERPPVELGADLWVALRLPDKEFDAYYERNGWAETWSNLLAEVRLRSGARSCGEDADGEPCMLMTESHLVHYGESDVGSSEPLPAPEAREEPTAKVVTRPSDTECGGGFCPAGCSHLMWKCSACSSEGGWGALREQLEEWATAHVCPPTRESSEVTEAREEARRKVKR